MRSQKVQSGQAPCRLRIPDRAEAVLGSQPVVETHRQFQGVGKGPIKVPEQELVAHREVD